MQAGKNIIESGDKDFEKIEIEPEEFIVLIFTSGTTSKLKGVMIANRSSSKYKHNIPAYITLYQQIDYFQCFHYTILMNQQLDFISISPRASIFSMCEGLKYIVPRFKESRTNSLILAVPTISENFYKKIMDSIKKSHKDKLVKSMMITNALSNRN